MYTAPEQGRQTPGDKILMSAERSYHFTDLLQVNHWSRTNGLVANKIPEFMIIKNLLQVDLHVHKFSEAYLVFTSLFLACVMHQSFVATAPPPAPTGMGVANVRGSDLFNFPVPSKCRACDIMQIYPLWIYYNKERGYDSQQGPAVQGF